MSRVAAKKRPNNQSIRAVVPDCSTFWPASVTECAHCEEEETEDQDPDVELLGLAEDVRRRMLAWRWEPERFVVQMEALLRRVRDHFETMELPMAPDSVVPTAGSTGYISIVPTKEEVIQLIKARGVKAVYPRALEDQDTIIARIRNTPDERWYPADDIYWQRP